MTTWDYLALEFDGTTEAFIRLIKAFKSVAQTYDELRDYCETLIYKKNQ